MKMKTKLADIKGYFLVVKKRLESVLRLVKFPGFGGVPLYDVLVYFIRGFTQVNLIDRAAAVAFYVFLALFPTILFLFTLLPYFPLQDITQNVLEALQSFLPPICIVWSHVDMSWQSERGCLAMTMNHRVFNRGAVGRG